MANPGLTKAYIADADIAPNRILKQGSADGNATTAATSTDRFIGVSENVQVPATRLVDVAFEGLKDVVAGGTIAAGDFLTSDANGAAITAAPAAGANVRIIGRAFESAVAGDIFRAALNLTQIQG